ncbi:glycosyltransferase family 2 protein [Parapedobacter deserti]|uniref:Glycosyltransferase family 2 protein n=1 Tax=Parapedobacter deserti TaxID=1912957 RepID=A0ABV7JNC3_9SPHI
MKQPLLSVIIPTYRSAKTIHACINSVLEQTFEDFEMIIQDGVSPDKTIEIVRAFNDNRIKVFSEKDNGVYDAMNRAIVRASGKWLYFLGSDDTLYERSTFVSLSTILKKTKADLVYGNVMMSGDSHWVKDGAIYRGETNLASLFEQNISHQAIVYRKKIFDDGLRFNLDYPICADFDLNLRCFACYQVAYTPLIIATFATGGMSTQHVDQRFEREKWENILYYYGGKLRQPEFLRYKGIIKKTGKELFKKGKYSAGLMALSAYFYFKVLRIRKRQLA